LGIDRWRVPLAPDILHCLEADMTRIRRAICIGLFSAATVSALGFGAAQAFAAPSAPARATVCGDERCDAICVSKGYAYGDCSTGACRCFH
jgi:hypothetical protein